MIRLRFEPPQGDPDWDAWEEAAASARRDLEETEGPRKIDAKLYKAQRERFFAATHGKCAYCELQLASGQGRGDVEHYRPKGRARDGDGNVVKIERDGVMIDHPGYYWLAYDHRNLLPACSRCNRRATDYASASLTGKSDIFPTLDGYWAGCPEDVPDERPALLNPWLPEDDPAEHLKFDPETGRIVGITERGKITVALLGLNRERLPEDRLDACYRTGAAFGKAVTAAGTSRESAILASVRDGSAAFAAMCRAELARLGREYQQRLDRAREEAGITPVV